MSALQTDENLAYHAARVLLLIALCGTPRGKQAKTLPGIEGRTLLAKLDFFLRYPIYLKKAVEILDPTRSYSNQELGLSTNDEVQSVESKLVRYLYSPWEAIYPLILSYLIGKKLICTELKNGRETFRLTYEGQKCSNRFVEEPEYSDLVNRANTIYQIARRYTGDRLISFINSYLPNLLTEEESSYEYDQLEPESMMLRQENANLEDVENESIGISALEITAQENSALKGQEISRDQANRKAIKHLARYDSTFEVIPILLAMGKEVA